MKNLQKILFFLLIATSIFANGVGIVDEQTGNYLQLKTSSVDVEVNNQVAVITTMQKFHNLDSHSNTIKYAFPLPEGASAIGLRYFINGTWYAANIAAQPQDTTLPGGSDELPPNLKSYLGQTPLFFNINQELGADSSMIVELSYVQLLDYEFGNVNFYYPNDYTLIQSNVLDEQSFEFNLNSDRTIESIDLLSHTADGLINNGNTASLIWSSMESVANQDYQVRYSLSLDELGLFSFSTYQPDTLVPDEYGSGFFTFIAEPDPTENTEVINKVFTLIIDRSGSMSGDKIVQARNAADFITQNLNDGDYFNIVNFSSDVKSFRGSHVEFNTDNMNAALNYISTLEAGGSTNISGAFSTAVPQFSAASENTANIIIFFTDGQATAGITGTNGILEHVQGLVTQNELQLNIFTFGIGSDANEQLLTLLASQNNGISEFLEGSELEEVITQFYLTIRNPVLLNTEVEFSSEVISEVYPVALPNLYKGQQMIVAGRYTEPADVSVTLSGTAFGSPVEYEYSLELADSSIEQYQFLPKIWAKQKIEHLIVLYYSYDSNSQEAEELKEQIIELSLKYGVITEFTSFSGGDPTDVEDDSFADEEIKKDFHLIGNYPNPFNPSTTIRIFVGANYQDIAQIRIYNSLGQLVKTIYVNINGQGIYEAVWNGIFDDGTTAPSGMYVYVVDIGNKLLTSKMMLVK